MDMGNAIKIIENEILRERKEFSEGYGETHAPLNEFSKTWKYISRAGIQASEWLSRGHRAPVLSDAIEIERKELVDRERAQKNNPEGTEMKLYFSLSKNDKRLGYREGVVGSTYYGIGSQGIAS